MKVSELIEKLKEFDQDLEVAAESSCGEYPPCLIRKIYTALVYVPHSPELVDALILDSDN